MRIGTSIENSCEITLPDVYYTSKHNTLLQLHGWISRVVTTLWHLCWSPLFPSPVRLQLLTQHHATGKMFAGWELGPYRNSA